jgi:hypothetical protein
MSDKINLFDLIHQLNPYVFEIRIMLMHLRTKGTNKSCFIKFMWGFDPEDYKPLNYVKVNKGIIALNMIEVVNICLYLRPEGVYIYYSFQN